MKLLNLYIEQFGGLCQYRLDFEEGLTLIREENGFGKTTLAEFIRAMFYGFPRKTKNLGKRQKYLPWSGGKCAGNLEFEHQGVRYRVERTFGATPKTDTFKLFEGESNRPSARFTENIGVELFGLDADSFERSTYLPQNGLSSPLTTDGIRAKLADLVEDGGDVGNFEKATGALRARRSSYANYRGVGGSAAEALSKISALQMEIDRSTQAGRALAQAEADILSLEEEREAAGRALAQAREQITRASETAAAAAIRKEHRRLEDQLCQARRELEGQRAEFPRGVPTREELEIQRGRCTDYLTRIAQAGSLGLSREEGEELARLQGPYEAGLLEEAYLDSLSGKHRQIDRLEEKRRELAAPAGRSSWALPITALVLGVCILVLAILLLVQGRYLPSGIAAGAGALTLILGAALGIGKMRSREALLRQREQLDSQIASLTHQLEQALGVQEDFHRAIRERHLQRERYLDLAEEQARTAAEAAELQTRAEALRREVDGFLSRFFEVPIAPEDYHRALDALARGGENWIRAQRQLAQAEKALEEYQAEHARELAMDEAEAPDGEMLKARERSLNQRLDTVTGELLARRQKAADLQTLAEKRPALEDQLEAWQEKKQGDMAKARLLDDTLDFLQQAKDSLATSYLGAIRSGFDRYLKKLSQTQERVHIDPDLNLQPERQGQARELAYLSAGQGDLLMLCMRLALVDALFTGAKPFVILDDPFVNLDDRRTAAALELLRELGRERQILYLTCNSSRSI